MKRILLQIPAVFLLISISAAQDITNDSLLAVSKVTSGSDLAQTYFELSVQLLDSLPDSALYFANQAELILSKSDPDNLLPPLFKHKGKIYDVKMVSERSLIYYRKAYDEYIKLEDHQEVGSCALNLGNIYYELADFSEAYYFYMHSLNAYERDGDRMGIARMENSLGTVAHDMGKLQEAEKHYSKAFEIYQDLGTVADQCRLLNNIGLILYDRQVFDSALVYFNEAIDLLNQESLASTEDQHILSGLYNNIALAYSDLGEYEMSLSHLRKGLTLARESNDLYNIGSVYNNLGSIFGKLKQQDSALFYLHRALRIGKEMGFRHLELETYDELAKLHAGIGSYGSAYNWLLRYDTVYKDLFNENQSQQIARLRARYEQEIKDREIEQLHSESQVQRMLNKVFIGFIVVIIGLVIIITVNLRSKKNANRMLAERNLQISNAVSRLSESEKELQRLNTSKDRIFTVVAHDLRNPVAAVTGFSELLYENFDQFPIETQKEYLLQIVQGTQRIQNLLENLLIWARAQMKAIKYEPEVLKVKGVVDECVKELKANLDHKKVTCQVKIDRKCIVFADKAMIHTVFRNLIMNAIKFSFPGGKIWITSITDPENCTITVSDEGIGIQPEIQDKLFDANAVVSTPGTTGESGSGLGLILCKEFLETNLGEISVESTPGNGSSFAVTLPISTLE
jgi:signal transduction histidine kinase/tetratricopeptide (TPR) repeat protein